ncbi:uncharacterized protein HMPREF1541_01584 [Cyphellophora europaea CBS 101466]|uniref:FHA domain-containing protein n=1 Tax=Cyphellophora europaea (strain CBS 101466) TaxID=1220924 RepID=W2S3C4_CYPE1|nr:uncharacterized protein HMPREF1541_01584 [Cyphellophora europaea CBS 101466]ETN42429.1 hypothetical protein HMPREF1541_01584 [Cyphellophora europaea CBS 101466]
MSDSHYQRDNGRPRARPRSPSGRDSPEHYARDPRSKDSQHDRRHKRSRSRSQERPRKRRSVTPEQRYSRHRSSSPIYKPRRNESRSPEYRNGARASPRPQSRSRDARNGHHRGGDRRKDDHHHRRRPHSRSHSPKPLERSRGPLPSQNDAFTGVDSDTYKDKDGNVQKKEKPNWAPTGRLAAAANTIRTANRSIVLKFHEPPEARKPPASQPWRMYVFKGDEILETIELGSQSCWLFGREPAVCDVMLEHGSSSKQHAVWQWRWREERGEWGEKKGRVKGYVLDLESVNGTTVNGVDIGKAKYYEVRNGDVVKFGHSEREYLVQLPPREDKKDEGGTAG